jgi:hypothetical protein
MALTPGNRSFPPDFAIRNWAYKGAADGDVDRVRCDPDAKRPTLFPDVNGSEAEVRESSRSNRTHLSNAPMIERFLTNASVRSGA